jgi:hypothetical protein
MSANYESLDRSQKDFVVHSDPVEDFRRQLALCRRISIIDGRPFILAKRLLDWFRSKPTPTGTNASRVLSAVCGSHDVLNPHLHSTLLANMDTHQPGVKKWLKTFAILLQLGRGRFIGRFWTAKLCDDRMPISKEQLRDAWLEFGLHVEEAEKLANSFRVLQLELHTVNAFDETRGTIYTHENVILPFTSKETARVGGSGSIFNVLVPVECIHTTLGSKIKADPFEMEGNGKVFASPQLTPGFFICMSRMHNRLMRICSALLVSSICPQSSR